MFDLADAVHICLCQQVAGSIPRPGWWVLSFCMFACSHLRVRGFSPNTAAFCHSAKTSACGKLTTLKYPQVQMWKVVDLLCTGSNELAMFLDLWIANCVQHLFLEATQSYISVALNLNGLSSICSHAH